MPDHLLLAFAEEDGDQVGAVAFERLGPTLRFLGGTEVTDYMGPVALPEARPDRREGAVRGARADWTTGSRPICAACRRTGRGSALLVEAAAAQGFGDRGARRPERGRAVPRPSRVRTRSTSNGCPPSSATRSSARRALEAEVGPWHICLATPETLEPFLDRFVELHRTSEGPKGVFMQPGMEIFFRRLGEAFLPRGIFNLTFIETARATGSSPGTIGFRFEGTSSLYNSAFDRAYQPVSPGMVLVAEDIRIAIEAGCSAFDLLKGDYAYKYRFGAVAAAGAAARRHAVGGSAGLRLRATSALAISPSSSQTFTRSKPVRSRRGDEPRRGLAAAPNSIGCRSIVLSAGRPS